MIDTTQSLNAQLGGNHIAKGVNQGQRGAEMELHKIIKEQELLINRIDALGAFLTRKFEGLMPNVPEGNAKETTEPYQTGAPVLDELHRNISIMNWRLSKLEDLLETVIV